MKTVVPDFYNNFKCKAGNCKHSCCKGWEIDIDEDSASYYKTITSDFGKKLADSIYTDEEGAHFKLTPEDRCPFLRDDNLCEMILAIGEESLCDICALHPRFYADYQNYELAGVGLSCEKVCELLWETSAPLRFLILDEDGTPMAKEFHFFAQDTLYQPRLDEAYIAKLFALFQKTEPIDDNWAKEIDELTKHITDITTKAKNCKTAFDSALYQRLFQYIVYRQLDFITDENELLEYAHRCTDFIFLSDAYFGDTSERIRRFSEQIEYSTENVAIICQKAF